MTSFFSAVTRFLPKPGRDLWLELKWTAPPCAAQVQGYADELRRIGQPGDRVVLIAPWILLQQYGDEVEKLSEWRSWTDVALALKR